jgi:hypothetical protein
MGNTNKTAPGGCEEKIVCRRNFMKGAATMAAAAATVPLAPFIAVKESAAEAAVVPYPPRSRAEESFNYRVGRAKADFVNAGIQPDNGDFNRFTDFSANYSKALPHDSLGIPNDSAYKSMVRALRTGRFQDFESIIVGTPGGGPNSRLNAPQGALSLELEGLDSHATVIPPAPGVASKLSAAEAVEHYWAALLRDVPFTEYADNSLVAQAVADMNRLSFLGSRANYEYPYPVTPDNLFRGQIYRGDGNVLGPYISQFLLQPTSMGQEPILQRIHSFLPDQDFLTTVDEFLRIQNGMEPSRQVAIDPTLRFPRCGRDLAAYTRNDVLYQEYFIAALVLPQIGPPLFGAPLNTGRAGHDGGNGHQITEGRLVP